MNYVIKKQHQIILILILLVSIGFTGCTMKDELTVVPLKSLEEFKKQKSDYLAGQKLAIDTTRVGFNKNNFKTTTDSNSVKSTYLAAIVAAQAVVNNPNVTITQIAALDKTLATPGKAFWAVIWTADRRYLNDSIVSATSLSNLTLTGNQPGQVLADAKAAFTSAISKATAVRGSTVASDKLIKMAVDSLTKARKTLIAARIPANLSDFVLRSKDYVSIEKNKVESSVVGYNQGEYPALTRTNYLNVVLVANDAVNSATPAFDVISTAITNMIAPKAAFLPYIADHRPLNDTIILAETLSPTFVIGTAKGQVVSAAKTAFTTAITTAKTARETVSLSVGATNAARYKMGQAIFTIQASITLGDLIIDCTALKAATVIGTTSGKVSNAASSLFATAITKATTVRNSGTTTYTQMTDAIKALQASVIIFNEAIIK
jgi:hypothetical protein